MGDKGQTVRIQRAWRAFGPQFSIDPCFARWLASHFPKSPPGHRMRDSKALHMLSAQLAQHGVGARRFHPFGQGRDLQVIGHADHGGDQLLLAAVGFDMADERAVNFDAGGVKAANGADAGIGGAEIIKVNGAAQRL